MCVSVCGGVSACACFMHYLQAVKAHFSTPWSPVNPSFPSHCIQPSRSSPERTVCCLCESDFFSCYTSASIHYLSLHQLQHTPEQRATKTRLRIGPKCVWADQVVGVHEVGGGVGVWETRRYRPLSGCHLLLIAVVLRARLLSDH